MVISTIIIVIKLPGTLNNEKEYPYKSERPQNYAN